MNQPVTSHDDIYHQAAAWLDRLSDGELDSLTKRRFYNWLQQKPANRQILNAMLQTWQCAELNTAVENIASEQQKSAYINRLQKWALVPAFASLLFALVIWLPANDTQLAEPVNYNFVTQVAQNRSQTLADGSTLDIGPDTQLDVSLRPDKRLIQLNQGLAYFAVAKDNTRPFQVNVGQARVVAVGTEFNVERGRDFTQVSVYEGAVEVRATANGHAALLKAGERIRISKQSLSEIEKMAQMLDWRYGWLELNDEPLSYLLEYLNRQTEKQIIASPAVADIRIAGRFPFKQTEQSLAMLTQVYSVQVEREADYIYLTQK